jgi:hypothetical protein
MIQIAQEAHFGAQWDEHGMVKVRRLIPAGVISDRDESHITDNEPSCIGTTVEDTPTPGGDRWSLVHEAFNPHSLDAVRSRQWRASLFLMLLGDLGEPGMAHPDGSGVVDKPLFVTVEKSPTFNSPNEVRQAGFYLVPELVHHVPIDPGGWGLQAIERPPMSLTVRVAEPDAASCQVSDGDGCVSTALAPSVRLAEPPEEGGGQIVLSVIGHIQPSLPLLDTPGADERSLR